MPASAPAPAAATNRSRWMRQGSECMAAREWAGAIRAYGQGLMEQPLLGMHYAANLERARTQYRQERQTINHQGPAHTQVVVEAAELSHNAAGRAFTLAQLYQNWAIRWRCWAATSPSGAVSCGSQAPAGAGPGPVGRQRR